MRDNSAVTHDLELHLHETYKKVESAKRSLIVIVLFVDTYVHISF